jgi:hypothetical protein
VLGVLEAVALGDELSDAVELSRRMPAVCAVVAAVGLAVAFATPASAMFAGPNRRITFARFLPDKDGPGLSGGEIFSAKPDGTDEQRLTYSSGGRTSFFSDRSPDGSQIAPDGSGQQS